MANGTLKHDFMNKQESPVVLYTMTRSNYHGKGLQCYGKTQDAMTFTGTNVIIAHPPCRTFSKMKAFSTAQKREQIHGFFAVGTARKNGGIVEHPEGSDLFKKCHCKMDGSKDQWGGYIIRIFQSWFGHPAKKPTLLYIVGINPGRLPPMPITFDAITRAVSSSRKLSTSNICRKTEISKRQREATPPALVDWLIQAAKLIEENRNRPEPDTKQTGKKTPNHQIPT